MAHRWKAPTPPAASRTRITSPARILATDALGGFNAHRHVEELGLPFALQLDFTRRSHRAILNMLPTRHAPTLPVAKVGFAKELGLLR
jgi:hypothetical protein